MSTGPLIVTRPAADAGSLIQALRDNGFEAVAAPLMSLEFRLGVAVPDLRYQAVLITSANGCRALGQLGSVRRLRNVLTIAVGETSADAARDAGQTKVVVAGGDVEGLIATARQHCQPGTEPLLYISGVQTTGELQERLTADGFEVHRIVAYEAVAADRLPAPARSALREQDAAGVILYSPRTAHIWCGLLNRLNLADRGASLIYYCLSENVAGVIRDAFGNSGAIVKARKPTEQAMIAAIVGAHKA